MESPITRRPKKIRSNKEIQILRKDNHPRNQETKMQEAESLVIIIKNWKNGAGKAISVQGASECLLTW